MGFWSQNRTRGILDPPLHVNVISGKTSATKDNFCAPNDNFDEHLDRESASESIDALAEDLFERQFGRYNNVLILNFLIR